MNGEGANEEADLALLCRGSALVKKEGLHKAQLMRRHVNEAHYTQRSCRQTADTWRK